MANTIITVPTGTLRVVGLAFETALPSDATELQLSIRISCSGIAIRDLAAFLDLTDHIYGRMSTDGLLSYARRESGHVEISAIRQGSWELIIAKAIGSGAAYSLVLIGLILKYFPDIAEKFSASYNNIQQGKLAKERRKEISAKLKQEPELSSMPERRLSELSAQIDDLLVKDRDLLHRASRFAKKDLLSVDISSDVPSEEN